MHKIPSLDLDAGRILGPTVFLYPDGYMFPYTVLVREAFVSYRKQFEQGAEFTIPKYGTLTTKGRKWTLRTTPEYAARKGYDAEMSGVWQ